LRTTRKSVIVYFKILYKNVSRENEKNQDKSQSRTANILAKIEPEVVRLRSTN